jgi:hypothetical protein
MFGTRIEVLSTPIPCLFGCGRTHNLETISVSISDPILGMVRLPSTTTYAGLPLSLVLMLIDDMYEEMLLGMMLDNLKSRPSRTAPDYSGSNSGRSGGLNSNSRTRDNTVFGSRQPANAGTYR